MNGFNINAVGLKLSLRQEQQVVVASLKKHCSNLERELLQHALGNDSMTQLEVSDNIKFIDCAQVIMRHYGD